MNYIDEAFFWIPKNVIINKKQENMQLLTELKLI